MSNLFELRRMVDSGALKTMSQAEAKTWAADLQVRHRAAWADPRHVDHSLVSSAVVQLHQAAAGPGSDGPINEGIA